MVVGFNTYLVMLGGVYFSLSNPIGLGAICHIIFGILHTYRRFWRIRPSFRACWLVREEGCSGDDGI